MEIWYCWILRYMLKYCIFLSLTLCAIYKCHFNEQMYTIEHTCAFTRLFNIFVNLLICVHNDWLWQTSKCLLLRPCAWGLACNSQSLAACVVNGSIGAADNGELQPATSEEADVDGHLLSELLIIVACHILARLWQRQPVSIKQHVNHRNRARSEFYIPPSLRGCIESPFAAWKHTRL